MDNTSVVRDDLEIRCSQAVHHFMNLPGFQLLEENGFISIVVRRCQQENIQGIDSVFQNIVLNIYSECLFQAVFSKNNRSQQESGFQELSKYLYRMAYNFFLHQTMDSEEVVEKAQDCTQNALERIFLHMGSVKSPGGFLKWCGIILRNICLEQVRGWRKEISLDCEDNQKEIKTDDDSFKVETRHDRDCLRSAILRLREDYQLVIKMTYFSWNESGEKMSDEEIARRLEINTGNLYTIRSRAISALKKDSALFECVQGKV